MSAVTLRASAAALCLALLALTPGRSAADGVPGDFDGDGHITAADLPGFVEAWAEARGGGAVDDRADMDGSKVLDRIDAELLLDAVLNPPPTVTPAERLAVMDAVRDRFQTVVNGPLDTFETTMEADLKSRPEFTEVRVINNSVCGRFKDGQWLALDWTPPPDPTWSPPAAPAGLPPLPAAVGAAAAPAGATPSPGRPGPRVSPAQAVGHTAIPTPGPVPLCSAMGNAYINNTSWLCDCFEARGYTQSYPLFYWVATVDYLKSLAALKPIAVLFYSAHGGSVPDPSSGVTTSFVSTATKVTPATEADKGYAADLALGNLVRVEAGFDKGADGKTQVAELYAITPSFVTTYWTFAQNSLVDISACHSDAADFKAACVAKGASVYAGWSDSVGDGVAARFDEFLLGRLLGINTADPKYDPPVRPFAWPEVYAEAQRRKLAFDAAYKSTLSMTGAPSSNLGPLAPVIDYASILERAPDSSDLLLFGKFGTDPGADKRKVFVGDGHDTLTVKTWGPEQIKCDLPVTGAKSSGDIQVAVYNVNGNFIPISEWQGTVTWTLKSDGTCQQKITMDFRIRGDVHPYREKLSDEKPTQPTDRFLWCTGKKGAGSYSCTGQYVLGDYKEVWSGSGNLDVGFPTNITDGAIASLGVDSIAKKVKFAIHGYSNYIPGGHGCTFDITEGDNRRTEHGDVSTGDEAFDGTGGQGPYVLLNLDDSYNIAAGKRTGHREGPRGGDITIEWTAFKCTNPPTFPAHQAAAPLGLVGRRLAQRALGALLAPFAAPAG